MKYFYLTAFLLFSFTFSFSNETLTLSKAIEKTLNNNPQLSSLIENLKAGKENINYFKKQKFGDLYLNAGITSMSDDSLIRPMTKDLLISGVENMPFDDNYSYWNISYSIPIYTGGKLSESEKIANKNKEAIYSTVEKLKWQLKFSTTKIFLTIISVTKQIKAYNDYISFLNSLREHTVEGFKLGKYPELNVLKINYEVEKAKSVLASLNQNSKNLKSSLYVLFGEKHNNNYNFEHLETVDTEFENLNMKKLVEIALSKRSDLKIAKLNSEIKKSQIKINSADWKPKVFLKADLTTVNAGNIDFNDSFWSVSANVSFPLFDMGKRRSKVKVAKHQYNSSLKTVDNKILEITKEVEDAYYNVLKTYQDIKTAYSAYKLQKEVSRIEKLKYENERGDIDDLLLSKVNLYLSETKYIKSKFDYLIANENLKKTVEGEIK